MSMFAEALVQLPLVKDSDGQILTEKFLDVARLTLPVIEKFGAAFALVKGDMGGNIDRLHRRYLTDQAAFKHLFALIEEEVGRRDDNHSKSCTKGLLWLNRALEFMTAILQRLYDDDATTLATVVSETYHATLQRYHGWLVSNTFAVAFSFVPTREAFVEALAGTSGDAARGEMHAFLQAMAPLLAEVHQWLEDHGLNDPAKV